MTAVVCQPSPQRREVVHLHHGVVVTDSLTIAMEFGRAHKNVLKSLDDLIADGTISRLEFKPRDYVDDRGKRQRCIELTEAGALIAMPFIGGKRSRDGQVRLVTAFMAMRVTIREQAGDWKSLRTDAAATFRIMTNCLKEVRAEDGKETKSVHYMTEARLVNWVMFGKFEAIDRDTLSHLDLVFLERLEGRNTILIARGRAYEQRKTDLAAYLQTLRQNAVARLQ